MRELNIWVIGAIGQQPGEIDQIFVLAPEIQTAVSISGRRLYEIVSASLVGPLHATAKEVNA